MVLLALGAFVLRLSSDTVEGEKYRYLSPLHRDMYFTL